jgi:hypothetical protein
MFNAQRGIGECRSCRRLAPLGGGTICVECLRVEEAEIGRLLRGWEQDLELLTRFDAYCTDRSIEGE